MQHRRPTAVSALIESYLVWRAHGQRRCATDRALEIAASGILRRGGWSRGQEIEDLRLTFVAIGLAYERALTPDERLIYSAYCVAGRKIKAVRRLLRVRHQTAWEWLDAAEAKLAAALAGQGLHPTR